MSRLKIAMVASECYPFAKVGGLADVVSGLARALYAAGHDVIIILPRYAAIDAEKYGLRPFISPLGVWMGDTQEWCATQTASYGGIPVYFIEFERYFGRPGLYNDPEFHDYRDNPRRFGFFTRAALQLCRDMGFAPDIVHAHDWQTALAPAYLKIWHWDDPVLGGAASVLTIHNLAHQGRYPVDDYAYLGLQPGNFTADKFEEFGGINMLKGGLYYADLATTVSPTYARETRTPHGADGFAPFLVRKGASYLGIVNGVDYELWNPASDHYLPSHFSPQAIAGKAEVKLALQRRVSLEVNPNIPLVGVVSRLVGQKGLDLLAGSIEAIVRDMAVQFVILGAGEKGLEWYFGPLPGRYPGRIGSYIGYNEELAHWIVAGSDFFLMPSYFEPCGLNQIYALKYGTLPIVRATGGLDDTVRQYDEASGAGTGFKFFEPSARSVYYTVGWAVSTYYDRKPHLRQMIATAMGEDFSWAHQARDYLGAYAQAMANKRRL
ncbi:MAG: glycogen synthase [Chloroflexales bacterium]|nr:glycogen synthase [Chloroflexales bacterium]